MKPTPEALAADDRTDHRTAADIPMPRLSDDAVVQIHDFIHHVLDLFEARYGDQIRRHFDDLSRHNLIEPDPTTWLDDPPF